MPQPNELVNPYFLKEQIIEYLKSNYDKYKYIDFNQQDSQSLITDIQSYITVLISNQFEQQVSDFYIATQNNDKIELLLSQYGYKKNFGIPSQVNLNLKFDSKSMIQLNMLEIENFIIPPLILRVIDQNNNIWLNKNSILVTRTMDKFGKNNEYYSYRMASTNGSNIFQFIQMHLVIKPFNPNLEELSRNNILSETEGYIIKDHYIDDFKRLYLDLKIMSKTKIEYMFNNRNITEYLYDTFKNVETIQNSKYHVSDYDSYIKNKYITLSYNEITNIFELINGDDINNGYKIKQNDLPLFLQYYQTKGENQNQILGQVNRYVGLESQILINDKIYLNYVDFNNYTDYNIKGLFIPQKIKIKYNFNTKSYLTQEELQNQKTEIYLFDLLNIQNTNESMQYYGYSPLSIIVKQEENVVVGRNQEKIESIKHNFNSYIKQKNKIVTINDINNYLKYFLRGFSDSLNQTSTYKYIQNKSYVNGLENRLYICPQLFKDDNLRNFYLPKGSKILSSELIKDPIILSKFNYTKEKYNIQQELKNNIIQTMDVQFQSNKIYYIYSKNPIEIFQDSKISINSIFYNLKDKLDQYSKIENNRFNIYENINLIDILTAISEVNGIINVNMEKFLESFDVIIENTLESNDILPLQFQIIQNKPKKIKTQYLLPISTNSNEEYFISNSLNLFLFENQIGEIIKSGTNEIFNETLEFENFIMQNPINIKLQEEIIQYDYTILPLYTVKDTVLPVPQIIDTTYSRIKIVKTFNQSNNTQCILLNYKQKYNQQQESQFDEDIISETFASFEIYNSLSC